MMMGLKGSEKRKAAVAASCVSRASRKVEWLLALLPRMTSFCEALKQPVLNANESEQHVGTLAVNCVRTGCKMANAHKIVVATSLYTGYTRRVVVSSRLNSNTIHDSSSRKQLRAITTLNTVI